MWCARTWIYCNRKEARASCGNSTRRDCAGGERAGGDLVAPRGHKKQKLNSGDQAKLWTALDQNPFATNRELRGVVENKISECSVSRYLARAKPCFTAKVVQDQEPEELSGEWKTVARGWLDKVKRVPLCKRIYQDGNSHLCQ